MHIYRINPYLVHTQMSVLALLPLWHNVQRVNVYQSNTLHRMFAPACVIVGRHIGSGAARQLPREPQNIPRKIPEMAIKRNSYFTSLY